MYFFFTGTHSWANPNDFCKIWVLLFLVPKNETYQKDEIVIHTLYKKSSNLTAGQELLKSTVKKDVDRRRHIPPKRVID